MNDKVDAETKRFERQAIKRYYGESGIIDLLIGVASLILSIGIYYEFQYIAIPDILIITYLNRYLRKKLLFPRLGQVEFKHLNKKKVKNQEANVLLTGALLIILIIIFFPEPERYWFASSLMLITLISLAIYKILIYKVYRFFIYFFLFIISIYLLLITKQYDIFVCGGLIISAIGISIGLPMILRFLSRYPALEDRDE
ncbi:MAG: hypothetical protein K9N06_12165 [Candidatus Cloacimonetes bacterium]|nr:hypothetical protein [Candidatus Cloacimonadota bacterium]